MIYEIKKIQIFAASKAGRPLKWSKYKTFFQWPVK